ncbi:MAG: hypothetical protein U0Q14_10835 [Dermatophilaceae bacterium]
MNARHIIGAMTAAGLIVAAPAIAAYGTPREPGGSALKGTSARTASGVSPLSETEVVSYHSTAGGSTTVSLSADGNIVSYRGPDKSGAVYEHIGVGAEGEGYVLCYNTPSGQVNTFDTGVDMSGWGAPTFTSLSATQSRVVRSTADGRLTMTQLFTFDGPNRAINVDMTVKNTTAGSISGIILRRQVDFDVDTGGANGWASFSNWHANDTHTSAFAFNDPSLAPAGAEAHAMMLQYAGNFAKGHFAKVTGNILDSTCTASSQITSLPAHGDFGDTQQFQIGTLAAGAQVTAAVRYIRF